MPDVSSRRGSTFFDCWADVSMRPHLSFPYLRRRNKATSLYAGVLSSLLKWQVSKRRLFDPNLNGSFYHFLLDVCSEAFLFFLSMTDVLKQAPAVSWYIGSDLRTLVNSLEIIFGLVRISSTVANCTSLTNVGSMYLLHALMVTGKQSVSRRPAWRNQAGLGTIGRFCGGGVISE